jgi:hypothetical protein
MIDFVVLAHGLLGAGGIPNPTPIAPPGAGAINGVLNNIKWLAGASLIAGFLGGLAVWVGGRLVDYPRAGRFGMIMMIVACAGAILYGISYPTIEHFAGYQQ